MLKIQKLNLKFMSDELHLDRVFTREYYGLRCVNTCKY